jgi:hypothetical protein
MTKRSGPGLYVAHHEDHRVEPSDAYEHCACCRKQTDSLYYFQGQAVCETCWTYINWLAAGQPEHRVPVKCQAGARRGVGNRR